MKYPSQILMVRPSHFRIAYSINKHMDLNSQIDHSKAMKQWKAVRRAYEELGFQVIELQDQEDLPDMVFCANTVFTYPNGVILSEMTHSQRKPEVEQIDSVIIFKNKDKANGNFEAMGDLIWNYESSELYGGYGFRTDKLVYNQIEKIIDIKVIRLKLINENYYHLDTCLSILNKNTALYVESAFEKQDIKLLQSKFTNLIQVDEEEALRYLACNAHSPDGKNVLLEINAKKLRIELDKCDFKTIPIDTSEFLKAGGSIFCMKNQGWFNEN